jgi:fatty-acyl-CoA synthase
MCALASSATSFRAQSLLGWLDVPRTDRGVRFARAPRGWDYWSWAQLASAARDAAARLAEHATRPTGAVAIIAPNGPEFIAAFYGSLLAGFTPCPLAPPKIVDDLEQYRVRVSRLLAVAHPVCVVTVDECSDALVSVGAKPPITVFTAKRHAADFAPRQLPDLGLLQFTSGSSGHPRAVQVTRENLEANLRAIQEVVRIDAVEDDVVTWLPTYHDLGLIGCTLTPAATQVGLSMLRVEEFVMRPQRWLECLGGVDERSTLTGAPPFGLGYALKRVSDEDVERMDFSRWRLAILGAERIDAGLLSRFIHRFRQQGLATSVLAPAYGLAEATLMVTVKQSARVARVVRPDWSTIALGKATTIEGTADLDDYEMIADGAGWLVSCGSCPQGVGVAAVGDDDASVPEGVVGELVVTGDCVAHGYLNDRDATAERFDDRRLRSGDAGFILDGELYVIGRIANALKVHGRWLFVEDVEAAVFASGLLERSRCVVFAGAHPTGDEVVVLAERDPGDWVDALAELLRTHVPDVVGVRVLSAERGSIARTSSGKPRRAVLWARHLAGEFHANTAYFRAPGGLPAAAPCEASR